MNRPEIANRNIFFLIKCFVSFQVVSSIEDAVTNSAPRMQYWCASTPQKILFWVINQLSLEVVDRLCSSRPPKKVVDFLQAINSSS